MHEHVVPRLPPHYSSIARNVLWKGFCHVFDSEVLHFGAAAEAEESFVDLPASIEQNRCGDDGHESLRFKAASDFVRLWKTTVCQILDHCLAIVESKSPPPHIPIPRSPTVPPGQAHDAWGVSQLQEFAGAFSFALWLCAGSKEVGCFATCEGEVFRPLGETEVADAATVYKIEIVAKVIARGTPACTKCSVQCTAVKRVRLDADNGADDVRAMLDDCGVLVDRVDKLHCEAVEAAEASQRRNV